MKSLTSLALLAGVFTVQSFGTSVGGVCGFFSPTIPSSGISGQFVCPSAAALGDTGSLTGFSEYVILSASYSSPLSANVTDQTVFNISNGATNTLTTSGAAVSNPTSLAGLVFNNATSTLPAGFYDTLAPGIDPVVSWSTSFSAGSAIESTGYAIVVYNPSGGGASVVGLCTLFFVPGNTTTSSGSGTCPSAAALGVGPVASEYVIYDSGYSSGLSLGNNTSQTVFTITGTGVAHPTDTVTASNGAGSPATTNSLGLPLNGVLFPGVAVLPGFVELMSNLNTPTITFSNSFPANSVLASTGYAEVVYSNDAVVVSPEPVSMALFGSGLLALCVAAAYSRCSFAASARYRARTRTPFNRGSQRNDCAESDRSLHARSALSSSPKPAYTTASS